MKYILEYIRAWLIIKKKQLAKYTFVRDKNYTKFVILCSARSGSTWLHTLLNSHPRIISNGEVLRMVYEKGRIDEFSSLEEFVFVPYSATIQAVGLKLFYAYQEDEQYKRFFNEILSDPSFRVIHLVREDKLAQCVSLRLAEETQQWSSNRNGKVARPTKMKINVDDFVLYKHKVCLEEKQLDELFSAHKMLKVNYEHLYQNLDENLVKIQEFLEVKPIRLFSLLQKQSSGSASDQIENWNDFLDLETSCPSVK